MLSLFRFRSKISGRKAISRDATRIALSNKRSRFRDRGFDHPKISISTDRRHHRSPTPPNFVSLRAVDNRAFSCAQHVPAD